MKPFSIAGMQLELSALRENVTTMGVRLDVLMNVYPRVQMVVFSELSTCYRSPRLSRGTSRSDSTPAIR